MILDKVLTVSFYIAFPLLIVILMVAGNPLWASMLIVAIVSFAVVTWIRSLIDAPRPYEINQRPSAIPRVASGKSFPSRHVFSASLIAVDWLAVSPIIGVILCVGALALAVCRVRGGVHFPRDVIAGAIIGACCGWIGAFLVPMLTFPSIAG